MMKKKKKKNHTSGQETRIKMMILLKEVEDYSHSFVKRPFQKNMLKTHYGNLKWAFWKGTLQWKWLLKLSIL